jgi:hypothetical protein
MKSIPPSYPPRGSDSLLAVPDDDPLLDPREVDALIARTIAYCEHAGITPPSPERARELIGAWGQMIAANARPGTPH